MIKLLDGAGSGEARSHPQIERRFEATFYNTGNMLFFAALKKHLPQAEAVYSWQDLLVDNNVAIISMANFINPYTDVTNEVKALKNSNVERIVLIGCGAQSLTYDQDFALRPDTIDFLSIVKERSTSIGVRGFYTAELLERHGFKNVRVIGCPSFFMSGASAPAIRSVARPKRITIGASPSGDMRDEIKALFDYAMRHDATYILQSESQLLGAFTDTPTEEQLNKLSFFTHYYCPPDFAPEDFRAWLLKRSGFVFNLDAWFAMMAETDLTISSRLHGSVAAIHGGCQALTLVHDTRTRELCELFNLPLIDLRAFSPDVPPARYAELADFGNFHACYPLRLAEYCTFLDENGLNYSGLDASGQDRDRQPDAELGHLPIGRATAVRKTIRLIDDARFAPEFSTISAALATDRGALISPLELRATCTDMAMIAAGLDIDTKFDVSGDVPMNEDASTDALRKDALAKLAALKASLAAYTRASGLNPEFVLGPHAKSSAIDPAKLARCHVVTDRRHIIQQMPDEGIVAEVGTQTGRFAKFILSTHKYVQLKTIDIDYSLFAHEEVESFVAAGRLQMIEGSSWDELARFEDDFFSWIYIDASHFYDHVKKDLESAKRRVKVGGYIICNDYTNWSPFEGDAYGVLQAVNEFLQAEDFEVSHFALHPFGYNDIALRRRS